MSVAKKEAPTVEVVTGVFSKRTAADRISAGVRHLHSFRPGKDDAAVKLTEIALSAGNVPTYSWELVEATRYEVRESAKRGEVIDKVLDGAKGRRDLKERLGSTLEELLTNAIYHSYQNGDAPKYRRRDSIVLMPSEVVEVRVAQNTEGIFVSVMDAGGNLEFQKLAASFSRCYTDAEDTQLETKESGAGLGLYMIFDAVTHLKIECAHGKRTHVSCWFADKSTFDPATFSFNFFEK